MKPIFFIFVATIIFTLSGIDTANAKGKVRDKWCWKDKKNRERCHFTERRCKKDKLNMFKKLKIGNLVGSSHCKRKKVARGKGTSKITRQGRGGGEYCITHRITKVSKCFPSIHRCRRARTTAGILSLGMTMATASKCRPARGGGGRVRAGNKPPRSGNRVRVGGRRLPRGGNSAIKQGSRRPSKYCAKHKKKRKMKCFSSKKKCKRWRTMSFGGGFGQFKKCRPYSGGGGYTQMSGGRKPGTSVRGARPNLPRRGGNSAIKRGSRRSGQYCSRKKGSRSRKCFRSKAACIAWRAASFGGGFGRYKKCRPK